MGSRQGGLGEGRSALNNRVRGRLREAFAQRTLSHRDVAEFVGWGVNKVTQKLTGRTPMTLNEMEQLCFAAGLQPTEAVRDRGLEFCAEMTPTELFRHQQFQRAPRPIANAIDQLLKTVSGDAEMERRGLTGKKASGERP